MRWHVNILVDALADHVNINGKSYEIYTDFRNMILFELLMQDPEVDNYAKATGGIELLFPEVPEDLGAATDCLIWFYRCGKPERRSRKEEPENQEEDAGDGCDPLERVYSFDHDDRYIYAAFLSQYGIDLQEIDHLHWWKFRAMMDALNEEHLFVKIMQYRSMDISADMTKEQRQYYQKMKELYALPLPQSVQDKQDQIADILMSGGSLDGVL